MPIGFSDHSLGIDFTIASVAMGACIIEKHITISRKMVGPDHFFAIEPKELQELVYKIRNLENLLVKLKKSDYLPKILYTFVHLQKIK